MGRNFFVCQSHIIPMMVSYRSIINLELVSIIALHEAQLRFIEMILEPVCFYEIPLV